MQVKRFRLAAGAAMVAAACAAMANDRDRGRDRDDDDAVSAALVKARQKIFGVENVDERGRVDKEKVIFSWATNTTYVASVLGRVILLDSYLSRPELPTSPIDRRYNPLLPKDLADAKPEAIFVGHGHGDHADNAAFIAKWSGATIYASAETCQVMQLDVQRMSSDPNTVNGGVKIIPDGNPVKCVDVVRPARGRDSSTKPRAARRRRACTRSIRRSASSRSSSSIREPRRWIRPSRTRRSSILPIRATPGARSRRRRRW